MRLFTPGVVYYLPEVVPAAAHIMRKKEEEKTARTNVGGVFF